MKSRFVLAIFVCAVVHSATAQNEYPFLKPNGKNFLGLLNSYIVSMSDPGKSKSLRFEYKKEAQKLFINDCNNYAEIVEFENGEKETIERDGVTIQVSYLQNNPPRIKPLKDYFTGLIQRYYKPVKMESTDIVDMRMSKMQPYGKDSEGRQLYVCSVYFDQVISGVTPEGREYKNIAHKRVVCYIDCNDYYNNLTGEPIIDETTNQPRTETMIKFGDVHVSSIEKLW